VIGQVSIEEVFQLARIGFAKTGVDHDLTVVVLLNVSTGQDLADQVVQFTDRHRRLEGDRLFHAVVLAGDL
jgi:hypothetical protein